MNETLSGHLQELTNIGKFQLGNPKSGHSHQLERSLTRAFHTKFKSQFSFTKVVITRAGHLLEWSLGEL